MHVRRPEACCLLVLDGEGATTTRAFQGRADLRMPSHLAEISTLYLLENTSSRSQTNTPSYIALRSPSANMDIDKAPEHMTKGLDELYLKRTKWVMEMRASGADVFRGCKRPCDPTSATKTLEDLVQLASDPNETRKHMLTDIVDQNGPVDRHALRAVGQHASAMCHKH